MDPREFAAAQNHETRKITAKVRRVVVQNGAPVTEADREALAKKLLPQVKRSRVRVHDLANEMLGTQAERADVEIDAQPVREYQQRALVKVLERTTGVPDDKSSERRKVSVTMADPKTRSDVRKRVTVTDENRNDPVVTKVVADRTAAAVERHVRNAGREAVSDAAEAAGDEIGWARVLSGAESCPFCAMLASRGPVYGSADSAGFVTQRSGRYDAGEAKAYHDNCDCVCVPVFEGVPWYGQEHYELLEDLWIESTSGLSAPDSAKAFAQALKKTNLTLLPDTPSESDNDDYSPRTGRKSNSVEPEATAEFAARRKAESDADARRELEAWLDSEKRYADDTASWLSAEAKYKSDVDAWLASESEYEAVARAEAERAAAATAAEEAKQAAERQFRPRQFSEAEGQSWAEKIWAITKDNPGPLVDAEIEAIGAYTSTSFSTWNRGLRGLLDRPMRDFALRSIGHVESAIDKAPRVPEPIVVTRNISVDAVEGVLPESAASLIGREFLDKGFMSTSVQAYGEGTAIDGVKEYVMRLTVPEGIKALYVSQTAVSNKDGDSAALSAAGKNENELLIGRGVTYRITDVEPGATHADPAVLHAEIISQVDQPPPAGGTAIRR